MKTAFLFPGQGAQKVGMGKDLYEKYDEVRKVFDEASNISEIDIATLCFNGIRKKYNGNFYVDNKEQGEDLNNTENTQIAIATMSLAILEVLKSKGINSDILAGLSLGEYPALIYSGIIDFNTGIELLKYRGFYMQNKVPKANYAMLAVIGTDSKLIEEVCEIVSKKGKFVVPANYNYSAQTVISGTNEAIEEAEALLKEKGAKKVVRLNTSGPFHTSLLKEAKEEYEKILETISFNAPSKKVYRNIDGKPYVEGDDMKTILSNHIISPVRFVDIIKNMIADGVNTFVEIGPGKTLTGFIKKEKVDANIINIFDVATLEEAISMLEKQ